ncbi:hypothetical protein E1211_15275 [Micromonospora sp. 15K316]|uniref:hypothetical protein n=1 Tax=Micromonospora sp. 15K316 TaxID=2530376 RepID=UPI001048094B|nr:hypothetical protein [Micromonospora sp. 15K316]TDC35665.1 hypothetical protein E1211_15275 [Micromonospora sp. 15K316]
MPRIRTIKPSFFKSEDVSVLPFRARLTWVGLWTHADDQGRLKDNARLIKGDVWPLDDVSLADIEDDLAVLAANGRIIRYEVAGVRYLEVVNWHEHQKISKPTPSRIPGPAAGTSVDESGDEQPNEPRNVENGTSSQVNSPSRNAPGTLPEDSRNVPGGKGREKEGKGREGTRARADDEPESTSTQPTQSPPSNQCEDHRDHPNPPPCGKCADARKARERWDRDQAAILARIQSERARQQAAAVRAAIDACPLCDQHGQRDGRLCLHDPDMTTRSRRGAELAAAAIRRQEKP